MTRNRFNQAKHQSTSTSTNNITLSKARGLFLEYNDNVNMKDTYKIRNVHPPTDEKDVVNKEYCDNNLLSSNNKIDILSKNINELRKGEFEEVTTGQLNTNIIRLPSSTTNGGAINNKFNQNITNIHLDDMFTNGLREMKEYNKSLRKVIVQYIVALLLRSKLIENKEQNRFEMHYDFNQEDIMKEIESFFLMKMSNPTAPSERLLYPNLSTVNEQYINEKIQANNKFNSNFNIIKDIGNFYETETNNYNKKLSRYKNYINVAEITEMILSSIVTTATTTSVELTGIGLPYSIPTAFATATVCGSLSKTFNTTIRNKIIKYSQMYILSKQFSDKFNKLYTKSMNDNKIDNDEYIEFVRLYEDYMKNKKNKLSIFLD